uniref:PH domain-containing protein n=1 Tax=Triticum urartu TaxID=4572 RepID=A0A8R7TR19_TRIUA
MAPPATRQPMYRILCKAGEESFSLAARDGKVCLVRNDRDDDTQHWIKDMKYSIRVKDEEGYPAMALVNKASGEALKHSLGQSHPVLLTRYNPDILDESVLWTESRDVGAGYRCIRMVNNIYLNFDALHGDKDHGGVRDGTTLILWEWTEGDNQRWKIVAWCKFIYFISCACRVLISCCSSSVSLEQFDWLIAICFFSCK